jgi:hypothetical protein
MCHGAEWGDAHDRKKHGIRSPLNGGAGSPHRSLEELKKWHGPSARAIRKRAILRKPAPHFHSAPNGTAGPDQAERLF